MKRTAKILCTLLALLLLLPCVLTAALADVLWEPNDSFYSKHYGDCYQVYRYFICNGPDGYVNGYKAPNSKKIEDVFQNGVKVYVSMAYEKDGVEYGVVEYSKDENGEPQPAFYGRAKTAWLRLDELSLVYDAESFDDEHWSEYQSGEVSFDVSECKTIVLWTYPGSGVISGTISASELDSSAELYLSNKWVDEDGREWGKIGYWRGIRNVWICASDPENEDISFDVRISEPDVLIPAAEAPEKKNEEPGKSTKSEEKSSDSDKTVSVPEADLRESKGSKPVLVIVIVAAVVLLTLVLIFVLRRKKKPHNEK